MEEILTQFAYADRIPEEILAWGDELARIRQDLHEHPELGFDTAVQQALQAIIDKDFFLETN